MREEQKREEIINKLIEELKHNKNMELLNQLAKLEYLPAMGTLYGIYLNENFYNSEVFSYQKDNSLDILDYDKGIYWLNRYINTKKKQSKNQIADCGNARYLLSKLIKVEDEKIMLLKEAAIYDECIFAQKKILSQSIELSDDEEIRIYMSILKNNKLEYFSEEMQEEILKKINIAKESGNKYVNDYFKHLAILKAVEEEMAIIKTMYQEL